MSTDAEAGEADVGEVTVEDEEGVVDRKTKEHIMDLRKQVDNDERQIYIEGRAGHEAGLSMAEANRFWGLSVRQYLRGIKRLWDDDAKEEQVKRVGHYWSERDLGFVTIVPPDTPEYPFSIVEYDDHDDHELRQAIGLPREASLPRPYTKHFVGLNSVLQTVQIHKRWVVTVDAAGPPPTHDQRVVEQRIPVPKDILEAAVEAADNFLQQAGVGFSTTVPDYMGGSEPGL